MSGSLEFRKVSQDFLGQLYRFVSLDLDTHRRISYASLEQCQP